MAWGNQSCGRLGLQEKKMEKAGASDLLGLRVLGVKGLGV